MKIFLTGGTGYTGAHLARGLAARGHELTLLARDPERSPALAALPGITLVRGDVRDVRSYEPALRGHHALVHHALVWDEQPTELDLVDPRASIALFDAAARAGVRRLVYTSSTAVHRPFRARMTEADALAPDDLYGMTKAAGELALFAIAQLHGRGAAAIRLGPVVGAPATPDAPFRSDRRIESLVEHARRGERVVVTRNDGRQFVAARDLARVYASALDAEPRPRDVLLAVAREPTTWESIAREAVRQLGSGEVVLDDVPLENVAQPAWFDPTALEQRLGAPLSADDALREHVAHLVARARR